jgi:two-component system OmpR family sensor kinase/two-component system sensor histidine kinase BaeS
MRMGLRTQLVISYLLIVVLTVAAVGVLASRFTERQFSVYVSETGRLEAQLLTALFAEYYEQHDSWDGVTAHIAELDRAPWEVLSSLDLSDSPWQGWETSDERDLLRLGQQLVDQVTWQQAIWTVVRWIRGGQILLTDTQGLVVADSGGKMVGEQLAPADLEKGARVTVDGQTVGTVVVAAGLGVFNPQASAFLSQVNRGLLITGLVAIAVALVLGWWLAGRLSAPARALTVAARDLAAGNWDQQLPVRSDDELGQMTTAFNEMATEITRQRALRRRLVGDMAHELRTPLSVLRLELEATEDGLQSADEAVAHVSEELELLERMVEDLRLLSQADAGELPLHLELEDLGTLVMATVERWQGRASARGLTITAQAEPHLPPVKVDRLRINQVLTNLLSNALRHTHEGGRIELRVKATDDSDALIVSVNDTGEGIPPDVLSHVFDRFYRPDPARSRQTGGTGLGLSIAREAVELHGGRIWAESQVGSGSTFYFTLPANPQPPAPAGG